MIKPLKATILSFFLFNVSYGAAITPALGDISLAFPGASQSTIGMVVTLPALSTMLSCLLSDKLSTIISKRKLVILGLFLLLIGGIGGGFYPNIYFLLTMRFIIGIGFGFLYPISTGFIVDFYDGLEREKMMGLNNAAASAGAIVTMLIAGLLCSIHWRYAFMVYLIALIPLLLAVFALPEPQKNVTSDAGNIPLLNRQVISYCLVIGVLMMFIFSYFANISIFILSENIGNAASTGVVTSLNLLATLLASCLFSMINKILKRFTYSISVGVIGLGFFVLSLATNFSHVILGSILFGIAMGIMPPNWFMTIARIAPKGGHVFAFSFMTTTMFLGQFTSSIVVPVIGSLLGNTTIRFAYQLCAVFLLAFCLALAVAALRLERS